MTPPTDTDTIDILRIVDTRVPDTSAAHATMRTDGDTRPVTVVWSTEPFACVEFELGNVSHDGPTQFPADEPPPLVPVGGGKWWRLDHPRCRACSSSDNPPMDVFDGHLRDRALAEAALGIAREAAAERFWVGSRVASHLIDMLDVVVTGLVHGSRSLDELPTVMDGPDIPAVVRDRDQLVAFTHLVSGGIIEIRWPMPTPLPEMVDDLGPFPGDDHTHDHDNNDNDNGV